MDVMFMDACNHCDTKCDTIFAASLMVLFSDSYTLDTWISSNIQCKKRNKI